MGRRESKEPQVPVGAQAQGPGAAQTLATSSLTSSLPQSPLPPFCPRGLTQDTRPFSTCPEQLLCARGHACALEK